MLGPCERILRNLLRGERVLRHLRVALGESHRVLLSVSPQGSLLGLLRPQVLEVLAHLLRLLLLILDTSLHLLLLILDTPLHLCNALLLLSHALLLVLHALLRLLEELILLLLRALGTALDLLEIAPARGCLGLGLAYELLGLLLRLLDLLVCLPLSRLSAVLRELDRPLEPLDLLAGKLGFLLLLLDLLFELDNVLLQRRTAFAEDVLLTLAVLVELLEQPRLLLCHLHALFVRVHGSLCRGDEALEQLARFLPGSLASLLLLRGEDIAAGSQLHLCRSSELAYKSNVARLALLAPSFALRGLNGLLGQADCLFQLRHGVCLNVRNAGRDQLAKRR